MDARHQLLDRAVLENVAFASQFHCASKQILIRMEGQKDDFCLEPAFNQFPCDPEPVQLRHFDIEKRDVWMELLYGRQSRFTIRSFAHYFQAGILLDTEPQSLPHQRMVICNQNSNLLIHDPGPPSQSTTNVPRPAQPPVYKRNHDCCSVRPSGQPNHPPSKRRRPFVSPDAPRFSYFPPLPGDPLWCSLGREPHAVDRSRNSRQEIRGSRGACGAPFVCPAPTGPQPLLCHPERSASQI